MEDGKVHVEGMMEGGCVITLPPLNLLEGIERKDTSLRGFLFAMEMVSAVFIPHPFPLLDNPLFRRDEEQMRFLRVFFFFLEVEK